METKFRVGQVVTLNDGKCTGIIEGIWLANGDVLQYAVVWWDGAHRHSQLLREYELAAV